MTVDGRRNAEAADDPAGEHHRFIGKETPASGPGLGSAPEAPEAEATVAEDSAEARDREECYHDLRAYDQAPGRSPEIKGPAESQLSDDGRWKWKGLELDREANRVADEQLAIRRQAEGRDDEGGYGEGGITPAMRRIEAELEHGTLAPDTERLALKSPDRFKEKLAKMISLEPDVAPGDLAMKIHDGIRYTFVFEDRSYSEDVKAAESRLVDKGYALIGRKPSWSGEEYKGINSQWRDSSSGQLFEVQFHTLASWDAKQRTHDSYERIENPATTPEERARLRVYQRQVVSLVPVPPGALEFVTYKEEGR